MALLPLVRSEVLAMDKDLPLANPRTLEQVIAESLGERRFQTTLLTAFGLIALLLASVGIYGVVAYTVAQRSKEIGIRMALGAQGSSVLKMVMGAALRLALLGVGIGLVGAFAVTAALRSSLYGVSATDPVTFAAVSLLLLGIAALASWAPARRATRVDPMVSLRAE
jgi:ABC-type antimicrobial peptide transport system permease subunit